MSKEGKELKIIIRCAYCGMEHTIWVRLDTLEVLHSDSCDKILVELVQ